MWLEYVISFWLNLLNHSLLLNHVIGVYIVAKYGWTCYLYLITACWMVKNMVKYMLLSCPFVYLIYSFEGVGVYLSSINVFIPLWWRYVIICVIVSSTQLPWKFNVFGQRHVILVCLGKSHLFLVSWTKFCHTRMLVQVRQCKNAEMYNASAKCSYQT